MARILVFSPYEPPSDGIAKHTGNLVEAWDSAGHTVMVVTSGTERLPAQGEPVGARSKVVRILRQVPRRRTWNYVVNFEPDIVFVQFAIAALNVDFWSVKSLCKKFGALRVPVVMAYHEPVREYDLLGFITRLMYRSMARVTSVPIAYSWAARESLIKNGLFLSVIEVSLGTRGVAQITEADISRVKRRYKIEKPTVLTLGFTNGDKGTDVLLDAAPTIAERRGNDVQFIVAGAPRKRRGLFRFRGRSDVKCQRQLERQAKGSRHVDIQFFGYVADEDVATLMFAAEVVALPYRRITQSGVANLALSSRSVVVGSDLSGLRSDLGDAARYVTVGDSRALADQIVSLMDDASAPLRENMRARAGELADASTFAKVAETILKAGLANRGEKNRA